jgi:RNA polymerase-binding transcription factor DksA
MATAKKTTARKASAAKKTAPAKPAATTTTLDPKLVMLEGLDIPKPKGTTKDGISYTKDFDAKFLKAQHELLVNERVALLGQASRLEDEANSLIEDNEMGDVQFDDESGEGDTMVVERERDLALSAQARQTIADIDAALARLEAGTYGYSVVSGKPIPRERLEAIPWATVLVEEKVGGIGRR